MFQHPILTLARLPVAKWHKAVDAGIFSSEILELVDGVIFDLRTPDALHEHTVGLLERTLNQGLPADHSIRARMPLVLDDISEPRPDVAIMHRERAVLLIEISSTGTRRDRLLKLLLYARVAVPEVWLVDLPGRCVEVYRNPDGVDAYSSVETFAAGQKVSPSGFPGVIVDVAMLFA